jgi:hypothetical protein
MEVRPLYWIFGGWFADPGECRDDGSGIDLGRY